MPYVLNQNFKLPFDQPWSEPEGRILGLKGADRHAGVYKERFCTSFTVQIFRGLMSVGWEVDRVLLQKNCSS